MSAIDCCAECGTFEALAGGLCPRCLIAHWLKTEASDFDSDELGLDPEDEYD